MRDLSSNRCRKGSNWGNTDSQIWTNSGCRGDFHVVYRVDGGGGSSLLGTCQLTLRQRVISETGARSVRIISGQALAVNPMITNVQGEADVEPRTGRVTRYRYMCTFNTQQGNRLDRLEYNPKEGGGTQPPTGDLRDRCAKAFEEKLRTDEGASVDNYRGRGEVLQVNPQVTNVQGEAQIRPARGAPRQYRYLCSFYTRENNRLARVEFSPRN